MVRTSVDLLKEASELARRSNTQLAVVLAALLVIGFNVESQYSGLGAPAKAREPAAATQSATCQQKTTRPSVAVSLERCIDAYFRNRASLSDIAEQRDRFKGDRQKAIDEFAGFERAQRVQTQSRKIRNAEERRRTLLSQASDIKQQVEAQVPFQLWDVELPIPFSLAPLFCLLVLALTLIRVGVVRSAFWRLLAEMQARTPAQRAAEIETHLYDMPFWLWPPPRDAHLTNSWGDLTRVVGWAGSGPARTWLIWALALVIALAALRLAWAGTNVDLFVAASAESGQIGRGARFDAGYVLQRTWSWGLLVLTQLFAGVVLGLLVWLAWPAAVSSPEHPSGLPGIERRRLILSVVAASVLALAGGQGIAAAKLSGRFRKPRWRRRLRRPRPAAAIEAASWGFYRNRLTGVVHYLALDCPARASLPRPNIVNLRPRVSQGAPGSKPLAPTQTVARRMQPADLEQAALDLWRTDKAAAGVDLLLASVDERRSIRAILPRLDLAAGLCAYEGLGLDRIADVARRRLTAEADLAEPLTVSGDRRLSRAGDLELLRKRLERWSDPEAWTRRRWNRAHPLSWGGRRYRRGQPAQLCSPRQP